MARRTRLDAELVRRGLARSRGEAADVIAAGRVTVDGQAAGKPGRQVDPAQAIEVTPAEGPEQHWASRGAYKLLGALDALGERAPRIEGVRALDAGASTGGFTDVLLHFGASSVVAVDVGYGQLAWRLRQDPRVEVHDRTNVRHLRPEDVAPAPGLVVSDLSFISLPLVLPALRHCAAPDASFLLMVKPQFEVGRQRLGSGGVVRDPALHHEAVEGVVVAAQAEGLDCWAVAASPLPGPAGNVEYFVALQADHPDALMGENLAAAVVNAIHNGPAGPYRLNEEQ
ncbi:MAG TPA: TlyA family RNA methyltransferase [Actinomycetaceae bacterium]|nr:TlyA family RNA methyltransferase [Actinomycetaceae bacterium]